MMAISEYELRQLPKLAASVAAGTSPQCVFDSRLVGILLTNLRDRDTTVRCYDNFLAAHGYTLVSGADPLDDVHADLNHDNVLMTPEWKPISVDAALRNVCYAKWPHLFDITTLDIDAIRAAAATL
jgi:hypothetical protein